MVRELRARSHSQLAERLAQVVLDRARADEQLRGDLSVGMSLRDEAGDLRFLRRKLAERLHGPFTGALACRQQLAFRAPRERFVPCKGTIAY